MARKVLDTNAVRDRLGEILDKVSRSVSTEAFARILRGQVSELLEFAYGRT